MNRTNFFITALSISIGIFSQSNDAFGFYDRICSREREVLERTRSQQMLRPVGFSTFISGIVYGSTREGLAHDRGDNETGFGVLSFTSMGVGLVTSIAAGGKCVFKSESEPGLKFASDDYATSNRVTILASSLNLGLNAWMWLSTESQTSRWFNGAATIIPFLAAVIYRDSFKTDRGNAGNDVQIGVGYQSPATGRIYPGFTIQFKL